MIQTDSETIITKSVLKDSNTKEEIINPEEIKKVKDKFRSYDEIKKSLDNLNLTPKMDAEIMADLIEKYKSLNEEEELIVVLEDLDFLVHQYDNAREFINQNGFQDIIYKNINSTKSVALKKETLKLMVSLLQNNIKPKMYALETGAINILLRLLSLETDVEIRSRALGSLSALLRAFPAAQQQFTENGGLSVLINFFKTDQIKIQIKLVTLISDLLLEYQSALNDVTLNKFYSKLELKKRVLEHNWCQNLNKLLLGLIITGEDHDSVEKCLIAMQTLLVDCGDVYEKELLLSLQKSYQILIDSDKNGDNSFFVSLKDLCDHILHYTKNNIKTEL